MAARRRVAPGGVTATGMHNCRIDDGVRSVRQFCTHRVHNCRRDHAVTFVRQLCTLGRGRQTVNGLVSQPRMNERHIDDRSALTSRSFTHAMNERHLAAQTASIRRWFMRPQPLAATP